MSFATIPELLEDIRAGRMVVIVDDEDRENEGDLIMAAELVRPSDINFMVTHARGLVCLSLTRERCRQLNLPLMVSDNRSPYQTNFTVTIEAAKGSICLDGVSLTVNAVDDSGFEVNLIPHTIRHTSFANARQGQRMNLEVDQLARYAERLASFSP